MDIIGTSCIQEMILWMSCSNRSVRTRVSILRKILCTSREMHKVFPGAEWTSFPSHPVRFQERDRNCHTLFTPVLPSKSVSMEGVKDILLARRSEKEFCFYQSRRCRDEVVRGNVCSYCPLPAIVDISHGGGKE